MTAKKSSTKCATDHTAAVVEDERRVLLYADAGPVRVAWSFSEEILSARPELSPESVRASIGAVLSAASWLSLSVFSRCARALLLTDKEATAIVAAHHGLQGGLIDKVQPRVAALMYDHHTSIASALLWLSVSPETKTARLISGEPCITDEERVQRLAEARASLARRRRNAAKYGPSASVNGVGR